MNKQYNNLIIGVDLDNTIISYDNLLYELALEKGYINKTINPNIINKQYVRDCIRQKCGGDTEWQKVQAQMYSTLMHESTLFPGVELFFNWIKQQSIQVYIVSHKTQYARYDQTQTPLREAALMWLQVRHFFSPEGLALSPSQVYFEATRGKKIERITSLFCTHFIDDLIELFEEETFPAHVEKILFSPRSETNKSHSLNNIKILSSWKEITNHFSSMEG